MSAPFCQTITLEISLDQQTPLIRSVKIGKSYFMKPIQTEITTLLSWQFSRLAAFLFGISTLAGVVFFWRDGHSSRDLHPHKMDQKTQF